MISVNNYEGKNKSIIFLHFVSMEMEAILDLMALTKVHGELDWAPRMNSAPTRVGNLGLGRCVHQGRLVQNVNQG